MKIYFRPCASAASCPEKTGSHHGAACAAIARLTVSVNAAILDVLAGGHFDRSPQLARVFKVRDHHIALTVTARSDLNDQMAAGVDWKRDKQRADWASLASGRTVDRVSSRARPVSFNPYPSAPLKVWPHFRAALATRAYRQSRARYPTA